VSGANKPRPRAVHDNYARDGQHGGAGGKPARTMQFPTGAGLFHPGTLPTGAGLFHPGTLNKLLPSRAACADGARTWAGTTPRAIASA